MTTIHRRVMPAGTVYYEAKVRRKSFPEIAKTFRTRKEAEKWARSDEHKIDDAIQGVRADITLKAALQRYCDEVSIKRKDFNDERYIARILMQFPIARLKLHEISSAHVSELVQQLQARGLSGTRVANYVTLLSHLFNVARRSWGFAVTNPVSSIYRPKLNPPRDRRLAADEEVRLLSMASKPLRCFIILALETAARRGDNNEGHKLLAIVLAVVLLGCAAKNEYKDAFSAHNAINTNSRVYAAAPDVVYPAVTRVLLEHLFTIQSVSPDHSVITAVKEIKSEKDSNVSYKITATVGILPDPHGTMVSLSANQERVRYQKRHTWWHLLWLIPLFPTGTEYNTVVRGSGAVTEKEFYTSFFDDLNQVLAKHSTTNHH